MRFNKQLFGILALVILFVGLVLLFNNKTIRMEGFVEFHRDPTRMVNYRSVGNMDLVGETLVGYPINANIEKCRAKCSDNKDCTGYFVKGEQCWNKGGKLEAKTTEFCSNTGANATKCKAFIKKK
jgi:hypothetical protein